MKYKLFYYKIYMCFKWYLHSAKSEKREKKVANHSKLKQLYNENTNTENNKPNKNIFSFFKKVVNLLI